MHISKRTWRWSLGGIVTGGVFGFAAACALFVSKPNAVIEWLGWALVFLFQTGNLAEWTAFIIAPTYYAIFGGILAFLAAEKKWKLLSVWAIGFPIIHLYLGHNAAQQVFRAIEKLN